MAIARKNIVDTETTDFIDRNVINATYAGAACWLSLY